jgi:hypothetical protein
MRYYSLINGPVVTLFGNALLIAVVIDSRIGWHDILTDLIKKIAFSVDASSCQSKKLKKIKVKVIYVTGSEGP